MSDVSQTAAERPPPLRPGDTVALIAPAGPAAAEAWESAVALLEGAGLRVWAAAAVRARRGYLAGGDAARAAALAAALAVGEVAALWAVRGGYGCTRLLPYVDASGLARRRPWLVGCSDISALHTLWGMHGVASLHAANLVSLASWSEDARAAVFAALMAPGGGPAARLLGRAVAGSWQGAVAGPLRGGNLTVLAALCGTPWQPSFAGAIALFEDVNEPPYRLDRALTQLRLAGALDGVLAVGVGQLTGAVVARDDADEAARVAAVVDALAPLQVPVVAHLPVGHAATSWPVTLGSPARLEADGSLVQSAPTGRQL